MVLVLSVPAGAEGDQDHHETEAQIQTTCPVMVGNKTDPALFTVYRGKKVFFCCEFFKMEFEKSPEKYLHPVPQFASAAAEGHDENGHLHNEEPNGRILLAELIEPMGILTLSLVAITVALGVFRRRWKPRLMLKMHKTCGVLALASGAVHAALVVFLH